MKKALITGITGQDAKTVALSLALANLGRRIAQPLLRRSEMESTIP
jgi:GDP-D-mannose dehydratase